MSRNDEFSSDEERYFEDDEEYDESESSEEEEALRAEDRLFAAVASAAAAAEAVQQAIRDGANVNAVRNDYWTNGVVRMDSTPLLDACENGNDQIIRILLNAGADARWSNRFGSSAIAIACEKGYLSTVQLLINHDNGLLEIVDGSEWTPLFRAIDHGKSDIVRFLLDIGANVHHVNGFGVTALMMACQEVSNLEIVRLLLAAGVDVEAHNVEQETALFHAACWDADRDESEVVRELVLQHNANMFAVDKDGRTPFDETCGSGRRNLNACANALLEIYGSKMAQDHGRLALHELFKAAEYSFAEDNVRDEDEELFHPPLNPLQIILPLGKLTLEPLRTLLHNLDPALIRNRDDTGKLPLHIACRTNSPMEVLALILEVDPAALHIADSTGALPIHLLCGTAAAATEYASVRYLVEQGGVGTLAARNHQGALPLHVLCRSRNPPLGAVQYLIQSFPGSVAVQTNAGQYPFTMAAAADSSSASLSVIYELVRASSGLAVPR